MIVQSCHACIEASRLHSEGLDHPHLVVIGVRNESRLSSILCKLQSQDVNCSPFYEPDIGNELTAIATEPIFEDRRHLFKRYNCLADTPSLVAAGFT